MLSRNHKKPLHEVVTGLHILAGVYTKDTKKLNSLKLAKKHISGVIRSFDLHELGSFYYKFPKGGGFTGIISLVESHISIHTWPELKYFTLDVYLCNYSKNNTAICEKVFEEIANFFKPIKIVKKLIMR